MLEKEAWGQPPGSNSGHLLPHAGADAWGVSLVWPPRRCGGRAACNVADIKLSHYGGMLVSFARSASWWGMLDLVMSYCHPSSWRPGSWSLRCPPVVLGLGSLVIPALPLPEVLGLMSMRGAPSNPPRWEVVRFDPPGHLGRSPSP